MNGKKITMRDIARIAGVSTTIVSRALRNKPGVSESKRKEIMEIAKRLKFYPNHIAKSLKTRKTETIGLLLNNFDPLYASLAELIEMEAKKKKYTLIFSLYKNLIDFQKNLENFFSKRVDGIIFGPIFYKNQFELFSFLKRENFPFVIFGNIEFLDCDFVTIEREKKVEEIIDYLVKKGKRKFAYLGCPSIELTFPGKLKGFENALRKHGIAPLEIVVAPFLVNMKEGYQEMRNLFEENKIPDALFCHNDLIAIGAIKAIKGKKFKIPQDVAVVGFDNIPESEFTDPSLTTIEQPLEKIAGELIRLLFERIENPEKDYEKVVLEPELILREST